MGISKDSSSSVADIGSQLKTPSGIAIDSSSGNVYVADYQFNNIQKFTSNGKFITKWGSFGSGDGQFNHPRGIAIDRSSNYMYVVDQRNSLVQQFALLTSPDTVITTAVYSSSGNTVQNGEKMITTSITLGFVDSDNAAVAGFECSLDGLPSYSCTNLISINDNLAAGSHTFQVRAIDTSGNVDPSPSSFSWIEVDDSNSVSDTDTLAPTTDPNLHVQQQQQQQKSKQATTS